MVWGPQFKKYHGRIKFESVICYYICAKEKRRPLWGSHDHLHPFIDCIIARIRRCTGVYCRLCRWINGRENKHQTTTEWLPAIRKCKCNEFSLIHCSHFLHHHRQQQQHYQHYLSMQVTNERVNHPTDHITLHPCLPLRLTLHRSLRFNCSSVWRGLSFEEQLAVRDPLESN